MDGRSNAVSGGGVNTTVTYSAQVTVSPETNITIPESDYVVFSWSNYSFALFKGMTVGEIIIADSYMTFGLSADGKSFSATRRGSSGSWAGQNNLTGYKYN